VSSPYQPPHLPPGARGPVSPPRTEPKAVIALVLAVAAYTPTVPFLGAIAALVLARMARRDIDASGGALTGRGMVTAARVLAWVHLLFVVLLVLFIVLALAGVFTFSLFGATFGD
jgi:hypothetical protein